jgi:hypothetical protein
MDAIIGRRDKSFIGAILYSIPFSPDFNSAVLALKSGNAPPTYVEVSYVLSQAEPPVIHGPIEALVAMGLAERAADAARARQRDHERDLWDYNRD